MSETRPPSRPPAGGAIKPTTRGVGVSDEWLREVRPHVIGLAKRFLWNAHDAEEVAQEALTLIWQRVGRLRDVGKRNAWLYRTTINLSIGRLRRRQAQPVGAREPEAADSHVGREQELDEMATRVREVVSRLPDREQTAIVLRDMEGLSYDEIAGIMRTRRGTARVFVHRARKKVRDELLRRWPDTFGPDR